MEITGQIVVSIISGFGGAYVVLKYLGTSLIKHQLDKSLKSYDAVLTRKTNSLKTELSIYAHEQNVAISRVDAQKAEAIQKIFAAMQQWANLASVIAVGSPLVNADTEVELSFYLEQGEAAHEAARKFANTLSDNSIFFDMELYSKLAEFGTASSIESAMFLRVLRQGLAEGASPDELLAHVEKDRISFSNKHEKLIQPIMAELTDSFRETLGVIRGGKA